MKKAGQFRLSPVFTSVPEELKLKYCYNLNFSPKPIKPDTKQKKRGKKGSVLAMFLQQYL